MEYSKNHIIEQINKLMPEQNFKGEKVITSGKQYYGWVKERLVWDTQVIINAVKCNEENLQDIIKKIEFQLTEEFRPFTKVETLVYKYHNMDVLDEVVSGVTAHFGISATREEILQDTAGEEAAKVAGCIILTAIPLPRIGSSSLS